MSFGANASAAELKNEATEGKAVGVKRSHIDKVLEKMGGRQVSVFSFEENVCIHVFICYTLYAICLNETLLSC